MLNKRTLIAMLAAGALAACSNVTDIERAKSDTGPLKLNKVVVRTDAATFDSGGRDVKRSAAQVRADLTAALVREISPVSDPNGLPANVNVDVEKLYLATIVDRTLAGTSYIESTISVTDAATGEALVAPTRVRGDSEQLRGPGAIGVITAQSLEEDYQAAINGYAKALVASLVASK